MDCREFSFDQIMLLWEVLWTQYLSEHFHLYLCVGILKRYRLRIIGEEMDFDTLLKFINELSGQINIDRAIQDAEALCTIAGDDGAACIPPGTPPSMPIEPDGGLYLQEDDVLWDTSETSPYRSLEIPWDVIVVYMYLDSYEDI